MDCLVDTSVLARLTNPADPQYALADHAVAVLKAAGNILCVAPQSLIEFRSVATRPLANNGLGFTPQAADQSSTVFVRDFVLLEEDRTVFPLWQRIVQTVGVIGKQVHDARLVAVCHLCSVSHILTFNVRDFTRFAALPPGLTVVDPATV